MSRKSHKITVLGTQWQIGSRERSDRDAAIEYAFSVLRMWIGGKELCDTIALTAMTPNISLILHAVYEDDAIPLNG